MSPGKPTDWLGAPMYVSYSQVMPSPAYPYPLHATPVAKCVILARNSGLHLSWLNRSWGYRKLTLRYTLCTRMMPLRAYPPSLEVKPAVGRVRGPSRSVSEQTKSEGEGHYVILAEPGPRTCHFRGAGKSPPAVKREQRLGASISCCHSH